MTGKRKDQLLKQSKESKVSLTFWLLTDMIRALPNQGLPGIGKNHRS